MQSGSKSFSKEQISKEQKLNRIIIGFAVLLVLLVIAIIVIALIFVPAYCKTADCLRISSSLIYAIDESVDPCEDFYGSICGRYGENYYSSSSLPAITYLSRSNNLVQNKIRRLIKKPRTTSWKPENMMNEYYETCMNTTANSENDIINYIAGLGWPIIDDINDPKLEKKWLLKLAEIMPHRLGLFRFSIIPTSPEGEFAISIIPGISNEQYNEIMNNQEKYRKQMMKYSKKDETRFTLAFNKMLELGAKLKELNDGLKDAEEVEPMSIRPVESWEEILSIVAGGNPKQLLKSIRMPSIISGIKDMPYDSHVRSDWIAFQLFVELVAALPGTEVGTLERQNHCVNQVMNIFPSVIGKRYVEENMVDGTVETVQEMIEGIKNAYKEWFKSNEWMDEKTRSEAIAKVENMKSIVAHPKDLRNDDYLNKLYAGLEFKKDETMLSMNEKLRKMQTRSTFDSVINKVPVEFLQGFTHVNAFYQVFLNTFFITSAILDGTIFSPNFPNYFNYGSIGLIIGHEIGHGFDSTGKRYDSNGKPNNWWTKEAESKYNETANCFKEQYNSYQFPRTSRTMNGTHTLNENIADNIGAMIAFQAFKNSKWSNIKFFGLDKYSDDQLFFYSYGHTFCTSPINEKMEKKYANDVHSMERFRVNGVLSNMPAFANTFQCKEGSPMNPKKKCIFK